MQKGKILWSVTIAGSTCREFDETSAAEFVAIIRQGHMPTSSQPAVGWRVYISHADAMPQVHYEIHPLNPAFITLDGPGCVAVQYIRA